MNLTGGGVWLLASFVLCSSNRIVSAAVGQGADSRIYGALGVDGE